MTDDDFDIVGLMQGKLKVLYDRRGELYEELGPLEEEIGRLQGALGALNGSAPSNVVSLAERQDAVMAAWLTTSAIAGRDETSPMPQRGVTDRSRIVRNVTPGALTDMTFLNPRKGVFLYCTEGCENGDLPGFTDQLALRTHTKRRHDREPTPTEKVPR